MRKNTIRKLLSAICLCALLLSTINITAFAKSPSEKNTSSEVARAPTDGTTLWIVTSYSPTNFNTIKTDTKKASTTSKGVHTRFSFPYSQPIFPKMNTLQGRPFTDSDTTAADPYPHARSDNSLHNTATPPAWES